MTRTKLVALVLFGLALTACTPEAGGTGNSSSTDPAPATEPLAPAAASTEATAPTPANPDTTAGAAVTTTEVDAMLPTTWEPGSVSCAELENNFPVGVDDSTVGPFAEGLLTYYWTDDEGNNRQETIQYLDDPTCTLDSDAWRFAIGHFFGEPDLLYTSGHLCPAWADLAAFDPRPENYETFAAALAPAADLCS